MHEAHPTLALITHRWDQREDRHHQGDQLDSRMADALVVDPYFVSQRYQRTPGILKELKLMI